MFDVKAELQPLANRLEALFHSVEGDNNFSESQASIIWNLYADVHQALNEVYVPDGWEDTTDYMLLDVDLIAWIQKINIFTRSSGYYFSSAHDVSFFKDKHKASHQLVMDAKDLVPFINDLRRVVLKRSSNL